MAKARAKATRMQQSQSYREKDASRKTRRSTVLPPEEDDDKAVAVQAVSAPAGGPEIEDEDADMDLDDVPMLAGAQRSDEPDSRAVDDVTDRIFGAVLSRYGWERHGNRIEHVGEVRRRY